MLGLGTGLAAFWGIPVREPAGGATTGVSGAVAPKPVAAPLVGAPAPDFLLHDLSGAETGPGRLKGQVVLINFWATWCEPCKVEMPAIEQRYQAYRSRGLAVLAVDFDEPEADVRAFRDQLGLTFPVLLDPGAKVQSLYRVLGYPTSFFVDRQGLIRAQHIGLMTEDELDGYLKQVGLE